ncbi:cell wall-associated hydrolase, invasion-associated protein [Lachnospiraceae bacterium JC7]|nr:cell wall-associated hydrolase, invasion-associated protein [Lachnospiraceae bacterium JC7]
MNFNKSIVMGMMTAMLVTAASVTALADENKGWSWMDLNGDGVQEAYQYNADGSMAPVQAGADGFSAVTLQADGTVQCDGKTIAVVQLDSNGGDLSSDTSADGDSDESANGGIYSAADAYAYATAATGRPDIVNFARQYIGVLPYGAGNVLNGRVDCSGFVQAVFREFGISLPRTSRQQAASAPRYVSEAEMLPGDLIFYGGSIGSVSHVAIYTGENSIVHATNSRRNSVFEDRGGSAVHYEHIAAIGRFW